MRRTTEILWISVVRLFCYPDLCICKIDCKMSRSQVYLPAFIVFYRTAIIFLLVSDKNSRLPKKNKADSICWSQSFLVILMRLNK